MFFVYVLLSQKDQKTYTGFTNNVQERLKRHNAGLVCSTKNRIPFEILFVEEFRNSKEAQEREAYWKSGAGRRKLKEYFKNNPIKDR